MTIFVTDPMPGAFAARAPIDRPPASTWWPEPAGRDRALPGEPFQPALFSQRSVPAPRPAGPPIPPNTPIPATATALPARRTAVRVSRIAAMPDRTLPDVRRWSVRFGVAILEALAGHRTLAQLVRYVSEDVHAAVQLAAGAGPSGERKRIQVSSARIQVLSPHAVEACLHTLHGGRHVLLAFRLAAAGDKWLCTELDVLAGAVTIRSASQ